MRSWQTGRTWPGARSPVGATAVTGFCSLIRRGGSRPFSCGRWTSNTTTSTSVRMATSTISRPLAACPTTRWPKVRSKVSTRPNRTASSSSTTRRRSGVKVAAEACMTASSCQTRGGHGPVLSTESRVHDGERQLDAQTATLPGEDGEGTAARLDRVACQCEGQAERGLLRGAERLVQPGSLLGADRVAVTPQGADGAASLTRQPHLHLLLGRLTQRQQQEGDCPGERLPICSDEQAGFAVEQDRKCRIAMFGLFYKGASHRCQVDTGRRLPRPAQQVHDRVQLELAQLGPAFEVLDQPAFLRQALREAVLQQGHGRVDQL